MQQVLTPDVKAKIEHLITGTIDGQKAYEKAAELIQVKDPGLAASFRDCANQRGHFASTLKSVVAPYGVAITADGSGKGDMQRGWMAFREAINYEDQKVILAELDKSEKAGAASFESALKTELPADVRPVVNTQLGEILSSITQWEALYAKT